ncbi:ATP-binding cassette domain-containing protein [Paenibacillus sp. JTLBN-2024]
MDALLKVNGVSKKYGKKTGAGRRQLRYRAGRLIGLLGSNGSGKSTLMQIIAGLTPASAGDISVMGRPTGGETKSLISYMPDRPMTESWMKVKDAIAFYNDFYADFDMEKAREMLDFMKTGRKKRRQRSLQRDE